MIDTVILKTWGSYYHHIIITLFILISLLVSSKSLFSLADNFNRLRIFLHGYVQVTQSKKRPFGKNELVQKINQAVEVFKDIFPQSFFKKGQDNTVWCYTTWCTILPITLR
jgi:hypothetical protein